MVVWIGASRLPSSTLFGFLFGGLLKLKPKIRTKGTLMVKGLLGEPRCTRIHKAVSTGWLGLQVRGHKHEPSLNPIVPNLRLKTDPPPNNPLSYPKYPLLNTIRP